MLPAEVVKQLRDGGFDVILKFGMGLLRVPPPEQLATPILSYHHGDPDKFRGRPAGFWEMHDGEGVMGQIVQIISNRLDAGRVVAVAETRVMPWSYRATLIEAFRHSPLIINAAVRNAISGTSLPKASTGRNCRLPSNLTVARASIRMGLRFVRRLAYGTVIEKAWRVSRACLSSNDLPAPLGSAIFPPTEHWRTLIPPKEYVFYADPFFTPGAEGVLVEALNRKTGRGEILLVTDKVQKSLPSAGGHMSYPATANICGKDIVLPEQARWATPIAYTLADSQLRPLHRLRIVNEPRLIDATLFEYNQRIYLFGNISTIGSGALFLWSAESLEAAFSLHPSSPIRISPLGSRMGGALIQQGGRVIRLGQDFSRGYGDGLLAFEIECLTPGDYRERLVGSLRFPDRRGPHTLNVRCGMLLFDWYVDRFSLVAGFRRLRGRA